ncbi:response regulator [candidate division FCPU426 bacterium]|nr:response regulator [candidate division FCPU426 bacterium]
MAKYKIMVVDDEPDIVKLVKISLEMANYDVIEAFSGIEALEKTKNVIPDLFLLDIMMPDMNGYEVCERLKADDRTKNIPVVMLTAKGQKGDAEQGLKVGADDYIIKPFDPYELGEQISEILTKE